MARKPSVDQKLLNNLFQQYFISQCYSDADKISIPQFGQYLRQNGVEVADYTLRRNAELRAKINSYKESSDKQAEAIVFGFKNLDVDAFLEANSSKKALKTALIALDDTYSKSMLAAMNFSKENKKLKHQNQELLEKSNTIENNLEYLLSDVKQKNQQISTLRKENQKLKRFIKEYVYPEIANELLKQEGIVLETTGIVKQDAIEQNLIKSDTNIGKVLLKNSLTQKLMENI